jgi:integrase/recombinase XerD
MTRRGKRPGPPRIAGDVVTPLGLGFLLKRHLDSLVVRGLSERTVRARRFNANLFITFCGERSITEAKDVTRSVVERYQHHVFAHKTVEGAPLSFRSQCELLLAVKAFFRWASEDHVVLFDPAASMRLPKRERRLPRFVLTHAEAERVLAVPDLATSLGVRNRAILEVLYSTGIRRAELLHLVIEDLDAARGTLFVREGKGRKDRVVPIGERAIAWVKKYIDDVREAHAPDEAQRALFVTIDGDPLSGNRLSELVKRTIDASGVEKHGSCHMFRHTAATLMLEGGADIRYIQAMLGHELLSTTEIYTKVAIRKLQEVHAETHPSAKMERAHVDKDTDEPGG